MTKAMSQDTTMEEMSNTKNNSFYGEIVEDKFEKKMQSIHEMLDSNISMLKYQLQKADSEVGNAKRNNEYFMQVVKLENNAKVIAGKLELMEEVKKYIGNINFSIPSSCS